MNKKEMKNEGKREWEKIKWKKGERKINERKKDNGKISFMVK
jgi:hypothetical protein